MKLSSSDIRADEHIQCFWQLEEVPGESQGLTQSEKRAVDVFQDTTYRDAEGWYYVQLPKKDPLQELGESRTVALKRFQQNQRSLQRKGQWEAFHKGLLEYVELKHAEPVLPSDPAPPVNQRFYLPTHGVAKESSTTTKLRIVFDGSATTTSGASLNDTLLPGPSLYPLLTSILNQFHCPQIGMSADISKMFREVSLAPQDRDLHRFLIDGEDKTVRDWRMCRVTFGVTCSPFLASSVLLQVARDPLQEYLRAAEAVRRSFYVDDCLTGAATVEEAASLREELNALLARACMLLRKWRSSSPELLETVPTELQETDSSTMCVTLSDCPKTLGVHWNTQTDTLHIHTPVLDHLHTPTKREIASAVGMTFDVLGWFSPATVVVKILFQKLWARKVNWDDSIPEDLLPMWDRWRTELSSLTHHPIQRRYATNSSTVIDKQLHGFCDASQLAYGGVVYLRCLHEDTTVSVSLVAGKSKVAPLASSTIPHLELCGALLLSRLVTIIAKDLDIPSNHIYMWCNSAAVLGWINTAPLRLKTYVSNRVSKICSRVPSEQWRYVSTSENPADHISRGLSPRLLLQCNLWWQGPDWLTLPPNVWPRRPDINLSRELPELKSRALLIMLPVNTSLWEKYSDLDRLVRTTAWCRRFLHNSLKKGDI